jgi:hypothetical protein
MELGSFEDTWMLVVVLISTLSAPSSSSFGSIATSNILDLKTKATWELLKIQLTLQ